MVAISTRHNGSGPDSRLAYFGTVVTPRSFREWVGDISRVLHDGQRGWLSGHHNLHSLSLLQRDRDVRRFYQRCDDCYIDGTPVRFILRGFGVSSRAGQRFSLMDHFLDLLHQAEEKNWSVFYLGSREKVVDLGRTLIAQQFPRLRIRLHHGYNPDAPDLVNTINDWRPDLLLVGMGMPLQERWLVDHLDKLDVGIAVQAGATLDYYTGAQAKPPLWMSRCGLAWLHRLCHDPVRLWRRYLVEPWTLLTPTLRQWCRYRRSR